MQVVFFPLFINLISLSSSIHLNISLPQFPGEPDFAPLDDSMELLPCDLYITDVPPHEGPVPYAKPSAETRPNLVILDIPAQHLIVPRLSPVHSTDPAAIHRANRTQKDKSKDLLDAETQIQNFSHKDFGEQENLDPNIAHSNVGFDHMVVLDVSGLDVESFNISDLHRAISHMASPGTPPMQITPQNIQTVDLNTLNSSSPSIRAPTIQLSKGSGPDAPVSEVPALNASVSEKLIPVSEALNLAALVPEAPVLEAQVSEAPDLDVPVIEAGAPNTLVPEAPVLDDPVLDVPTLDVPVMEVHTNTVTPSQQFSPRKMQTVDLNIPNSSSRSRRASTIPLSEGPVPDAPASEVPALDAPVSEDLIPVSEALNLAAPVPSEAPVLDPQVSEAPALDVPVIEAHALPFSEAPVLDVPVSEVLDLEDPVPLVQLLHDPTNEVPFPSYPYTYDQFPNDVFNNCSSPENNDEELPTLPAFGQESSALDASAGGTLSSDQTNCDLQSVGATTLHPFATYVSGGLVSPPTSQTAENADDSDTCSPQFEEGNM